MNYEKLTKTDGKEYYLVPVEEIIIERKPGKPYDFICQHSEEGFMFGDKYFCVWNYRLDNNVYCSSINRGCFNTKMAYFHRQESAIKWNQEKFGKKEEKQYDFVCQYSGEGFMVGDKCFYLNAPTIGCLPIEDEIKECYKKYNYIAFFHKKESAIEWQKHRFNNKEIQLNYVFDKNDYVISGFGEDEKALPYFNSEFISDRYKSVEECNEALHAYIWNTHKITADEYLLFYGLFINRGFKALENKTWKKFYCNYIINQKKEDL